MSPLRLWLISAARRVVTERAPRAVTATVEALLVAGLRGEPLVERGPGGVGFVSSFTADPAYEGGDELARRRDEGRIVARLSRERRDRRLGEQLDDAMP